MYIPEFLHLNHGNISIFSQQGLEKLNDVSTQHFQRSSNHRNEEALTQMLQKGNRIEILWEMVMNELRDNKNAAYVMIQITTKKHALYNHSKV